MQGHAGPGSANKHTVNPIIQQIAAILPLLGDTCRTAQSWWAVSKLTYQVLPGVQMFTFALSHD